MYLISVISIVLVILMAKHGRRKFRRYIKGRIDFEMALGTLAGNTPISAALVSVLTESAWLSSIKATWSLRNYTVAAGDGPVWVGVAHSDYSTAEIEAWIESSGSWDQGNKVQQETRNRKIRQVGVFTVEGLAAAAGDVSLNDGRPIRTKCGWGLITGQTIRFWAYNQSAGALTDLSVIHVMGHANLWPN